VVCHICIKSHVQKQYHQKQVKVEAEDQHQEQKEEDKLKYYDKKNTTNVIISGSWYSSIFFIF